MGVQASGRRTGPGLRGRSEAGRVASGAWLSLLVLASLAGAVFGVATGRVPWPDAWNPWSALRVEAVPNLLTRMKLQRLSADPALCLAALDTAGFAFAPLPDGEAGPDCPLRNTVRLGRTQVPLGGSLVLSCPAAVSLALWERHVVQPAALRHFGAPLARIDQVGSLACRNVYGQAEGRRSRHATADAIDITGFRFANGSRVRVVSDWRAPGHAAGAGSVGGGAATVGGAGEPAALFLGEVQRGACGFFDGVLGPGYNAAHRDHFHLDRGPFRVCR
ncbi:extensin family protein [Sphingomonas sp. NCPPB 2930]